MGRALLQWCVDDARSSECRRLWLTATNNKVRAFAFYQRFGMDLCAFHRHGVALSRRVKPSIPLRDAFGVAIAHELELLVLAAAYRPRLGASPPCAEDGHDGRVPLNDSLA